MKPKIPTVTSSFLLNLSDMSMVVFDKESQEFRLSALLCACSACFEGNFHQCHRFSKGYTVPIIQKKFKVLNLKIESDEDYTIDETIRVRNGLYEYETNFNFQNNCNYNDDRKNSSSEVYDLSENDSDNALEVDMLDVELSDVDRAVINSYSLANDYEDFWQPNSYYNNTALDTIFAILRDTSQYFQQNA